MAASSRKTGRKSGKEVTITNNIIFYQIIVITEFHSFAYFSRAKAAKNCGKVAKEIENLNCFELYQTIWKGIEGQGRLRMV